MTSLNRKQFLKLCASAGAALGLSQLYGPQLAAALSAKGKNHPPVLWLQGASCTGCSISLLNSVHPQIKEILLDIINLEYHPNLMAGSGELGFEHLQNVSLDNKDQFFLVIEGAVPKGADGLFCTVGETPEGKHITFLELVQELGARAKAVIAVGTCAAYGGIAAAKPNPTECVGISSVVNTNKVINIPGCPPHPDWIMGSLAHVLLYQELPETDAYGRPKIFYGGLIHDNCPRRQYFDNSKLARNFGEPGCLLELGCKGPIAASDCPTRLWNGGTNWCIKSGAPCLGCTHPNFPDEASPFYQKMPNIQLPGITTTADAIGTAAGVATVVGLGVHLAGNIITGRLGNKKAAQNGGDK